MRVSSAFIDAVETTMSDLGTHRPSKNYCTSCTRPQKGHGPLTRVLTSLYFLGVWHGLNPPPFPFTAPPDDRRCSTSTLGSELRNDLVLYPSWCGNTVTSQGAIACEHASLEEWPWEF